MSKFDISQEKNKWPIKRMKKMFNIFGYQVNTNQNDIEIPSYPSWNEYHHEYKEQ